MLLHFYKMNGAGNDFIVIDNRDLSTSLDQDTIAALCDRHRGIGADGLLAVEPAEQGADYKFRYYNADGGEAEMCGNGARCFGFFTAHLAETEELPTSISFETIAGTLTAHLVDEEVRIAMSVPTGLELKVPIRIEDFHSDIHFLNTGVPHTVSFVDDLQACDIIKNGRALREHPNFAPNGTNANFAQILAPDHIAIRTYERGVEDETLACGTGMVAAALVHNLLTGAQSPIKVDVAGGDTLTIAFEKTDDTTFKNVTLTGPADYVYEGEIEI